MRVAIDLDNTCLEWQDHWADLYMEWFDVEILPSQLTTWTACLDATHFTSMGEFYRWFDKANGWRTQPYVPGAAGALYLLQQERIKFLFVTSRPADTHGHTADWAWREWGAVVDFKDNRSKHVTSAGLWIDDSPEVIESLVENGKPVVRFARPWNEHVTATDLVAHDWAEALEHIRKAVASS